MLNLKTENVEYFNGEHYLKMISKKTQTHTRVKLPDYAVKIIERNANKKRNNIFSSVALSNVNKNIKQLMEKAGWTHTLVKTRTKRGVVISVYKNSKTKEHYSFNNLVSSHTMRRTAITTMLSLGMPEHLVRKVSGHAPGSTEFHKYVKLSQSYLDVETEKVFEKLETRKLLQNA